MKPITFERFSISIVKLRERMKAKKENAFDPSDYFFAKSGHRLHRVNHQDVFFIEGSRDYISIHTVKGKIISLDSLANMEALLPKEQFTRIHKSYLVNKTKIDFLEKWRVVINNQSIPVGETYRKKLADELGIR
jgi:DNA-binding LytR/AlgR family response regulator